MAKTAKTAKAHNAPMVGEGDLTQDQKAGDAALSPGKLVKAYDPETQVVVNKKKFEDLVFHLTTERVKTYTRQSIHFRLAELLDLPGGQEEARAMLTGIMERVMAG